MAGASVFKAMNDIIRREGGYVDHPEDKGGPTNHGVTQATLTAWRGKPASKEDVKKLTPGEAKKIYWNMFIKQFEFALDDQRILDFISDSSIHHGPVQTMRWLQRALEVEADGRPGPKTAEAYKASDRGVLYERLFNQRKQLLDQLGKEQPVFHEGWQNRLREFDSE